MGCGGTPGTTDYGAQARESVLADLQTYPMRYLVDAASKMGVPVTVNGQTYDFTGLGDADVSGAMSDQMAQGLLDIQRNYGADYVKQRLADLQQADPKGYAARKQLFDQILEQANQSPDRPLAENLQQEIVGELNRGGQLDARELQQVQQQSRGGQVAGGNYLGNAATSAEASAVVNAGDAQQKARQQQALAVLASGVSPEDVAYRRLQQSLGNLASFAQGKTPESEFSSLSAAGQGAAPFTTTTGAMPLTNPNAAAQGAANNLAIYQGTTNWAQQQANPWLAGLSVGANTAGLINNSGWNPFAAPTGAPAGTVTMGGYSYAPGTAPTDWGRW